MLPWQVAVANVKPGPCVTVFGSGQGWLFAVICRIDSTCVGDMCGLFGLFEKSPNWLMISAATPATFGVAIEVPCTYPYAKHGGVPPGPVHCSNRFAGAELAVDDQAPIKRQRLP